jgi:pSer/pThr/pTyr-binding forkhead associated (FHA) protein
LSNWILRGEGDAPLILRLSSGTAKTLGRTARADFIVDAALVSRLHCCFTADPSGQLIVEDLGSTNGTQVNGKTVDRSLLQPGDKVTVGRVELTVESGT